ncbi:hypothetical protein HSRCO_0012 [Halanaeroarchaeum sp. HSR-CO]|nr:hypothetical protein HSRCO_0012 [Halanaeroarchaeum sp. HSR-CO]
MTVERIVSSSSGAYTLRRTKLTSEQICRSIFGNSINNGIRAHAPEISWSW